MGAAGDFIKTYGDKAKALGAIIGLVVVVGGGGKWVYDRLDELKDTAEDVESLERDVSKLQSRLESLEKQLPASEKAQDTALRSAVEATRARFLEDERVAAELRGTVVALITEVRVRHGQPGYVPLPSMAPRPYGTGGGDPESASRARVRAQVKQNKLASEALDQSLGRTIEAIPQKPPLAALDL
jgi:hypothetical protein